LAFILLDAFLASRVWPGPFALTGGAETALPKDVESPPSAGGAAWPPAASLPEVGSFEAASVGSTFALLKWNIEGDGLVWSRLSCRGASSTAWTTATVVGAGVQSWALTGLLPGAGYECRLVAVDEAGAASAPVHLDFETHLGHA
jgi:hypothetical protein